jgi:5-oxoprolinase (ATP-hydrolysing) subunit A
MPRVTLNIDVGELEGEPEALYRTAHVVHVACGGHAGNLETMERAVRSAARFETLLGAHPSYPDRAHFGRISQKMEPSALAESLEEQLTALSRVAARESYPLSSVKAHGALYHDLSGSEALATLFLDAVTRALPGPVALVAPPDSALLQLGAARGFACRAEGFADRGKARDGSLLPRDQVGALISDPELCAKEAQKLAATGRYQTLCVHGDTPFAVWIAEAVRKALDRLPS